MTRVVWVLVAGVLSLSVVSSINASAELSCGGKFRLRLDSRVSEKTQQDTLAFRLTNTGSTTCALDGYPRVALLDSRHKTLPFRYANRGDEMVTNRRPASVSVPEGGFAYFAFNKNTCVDPGPTRLARTVRVMLPGTRAVQVIQLSADSPTMDYCAVGVGRTITVSPIVSRPGGWICPELQRGCTPPGYRP